MDLIEELEDLMKKHGFSAETMAKFIGCSGRQVDRWIRREAKPTFPYQRMIRAGIRKIKKL